jgi:hypothetical protein
LKAKFERTWLTINDEMPEFDLAILDSVQDFCLVLKPYCVTCATQKLDIVKTFPVDGGEVKKLISEHNLKCVRVSCECD